VKILVTGGAGFIGSAVIRHIINNTTDAIINLDKLTYAGNLESLVDVSDSERYVFEQVDICNRTELNRVFAEHKPDAIMHLAAESHVDRSIDGPAAFIETNIVGTYQLLEATRQYWNELNTVQKENFRFHHISTDEVYGDLEGTTDLFTETTSYEPSSPYSASKASSDHLVRSWLRTYGLPTIITNCSNNYGPNQHDEKFIPTIIRSLIDGDKIPVYGNGENVRDWIYVAEHCSALWKILKNGNMGETYLVGANCEKTNLQTISMICNMLKIDMAEHVEYVEDRLGHDLRYAIDSSKVIKELKWKSRTDFDKGLEKTVKWYKNKYA